MVMVINRDNVISETRRQNKRSAKERPSRRSGPDKIAVTHSLERDTRATSTLLSFCNQMLLRHSAILFSQAYSICTSMFHVLLQALELDLVRSHARNKQHLSAPSAAPQTAKNVVERSPF
jgi:hypothetical protein